MYRGSKNQQSMKKCACRFVWGTGITTTSRPQKLGGHTSDDVIICEPIRTIIKYYISVCMHLLSQKVFSSYSTNWDSLER